MKKVLKTLCASLIMLILITNISYASTEISEKAKKSLEKMFSSDIRLEKKSSGETIIIKGQKVQIQENEIKIFDTIDNKEFNIKYNIGNTICKFESVVPVNISQDLTEETVVKELSPIMNQLGNYDICYLAVADLLGVDLSLAYTYYVQNYDNETIDTQNKIYRIKTNLSELSENATLIDNVTLELEINCLEMKNLSENDINKTDRYTVTVIEKEEINPPIYEGKDEEPQPSEDETTTNKEIPKAGLDKIFGITISVIIIFAIIIYKQNKKYKEIF